LKNIISHLSKNPKFIYIPTTREDEALGIATGVHLGGKNPVVLMQNSGLGNSINTLTSLDLLYEFPILIIISWRGYQGKDAPEHLIMGRSMLDLLKVLKIPTKVLSKENVEDEVNNIMKIMKEKNTPVVLILKRGIIE
jgi:sulfopyruvate decarboxylase alpha subunit